MMTVIRHHGLIPIPVNIDLDKLSSNLDDIKKAYTPKVILYDHKKD